MGNALCAEDLAGMSGASAATVQPVAECLAGERRTFVRVSGIVQGVGFRPFIFGLARRHGLCGWVRNQSDGVEIEVAGPPGKVALFLRDVPAEAPPLARIVSMEATDRVASCLPPLPDDFSIVQSHSCQSRSTLISPDVCTCDDCLRELFDPDDRRFRYPFINCTNCGPRYTIIKDIPYDRDKTTMAPFAMCPECRREYEDPTDRRFHAQPNACRVCGPEVWLETPGGERVASGDGAVRKAVEALAEGRILAVKGLGGFHLAVAAADEEAVQRLRGRKVREEKPFAVMFRDVEAVRRHCRVSCEEEALLVSHQRPIVLLERLEKETSVFVSPSVDSYLRMTQEGGRTPWGVRPSLRAGINPAPTVHPMFTVRRVGAGVIPARCGKVEWITHEGIGMGIWKSGGAQRIAPAVAPRNRFLGAFLPYTPLHFLLFHESPFDSLVMTSGNQSDEPIVMENDAARENLRGIADLLLLHDRDIYMRCDDSVMRIVSGRPRSIRRARGFVPVPVFLKEELPPVLAVGAELKSTVCFVRRREAFLSQHIGDLENLETLHSFEHLIGHLEAILEVEPVLIVHDLHPDYLSTQWAAEKGARRGVPLLAVQHHHAHVASVLAERRLEGPVLGLALDGTGYGSDGTIWGGELLRVEGYRFDRLGYFRQVPLPGGEGAIKEPWRMAAAYLRSLDPDHAHSAFADFFARWPEAQSKVLLRMLQRRIRSPLTSSCGRLFDAVSALVGLRETVTYEGQAAIELEQAVEAGDEAYSGRIERQGERLILDSLPLVQAVVDDVRRGVSTGVIASCFHNGLAALLASWVERAGEATGLRRVVLSGGVFQNLTLTTRLEQALATRGFEVYTHEEVPANDACIALGQAYVGGLWLKSGAS